MTLAKSTLLASSIIETLAADLSPTIAKLYSHHTRVKAGQKGLPSWSASEWADRLDDAVRLMEASRICREEGQEGWVDGWLRSAEIFEWLSTSGPEEDGSDLASVSAALYQLAGYPARALAVIHESRSWGFASKLLSALLEGNFRLLLSEVSRYWSTDREPSEGSTRIGALVATEFVRAMGVICSHMRWGDDSRVDAAVQRLEQVSRLYLHSHDDYSAILADLAAKIAHGYCEASLRTRTRGLLTEPDGIAAVEAYVRQAYRNGRSLVWPSQAEGIAHLLTGDSFALFTPTGSGKTTVAELGILQSLFSQLAADLNAPNPLVLYLVPSRALAAEVEYRIGSSLHGLAVKPIVVTGLYGGTDWGPTDAWATSDEPTVLVCTYEKAEALIRFLGPVFIARISGIVLDEAHFVELTNTNKASSLATYENRSLKLESLMSRLLKIAEDRHVRVIALSAVAGQSKGAIAQWITGDPETSPSESSYHSTRKLVGRLECNEERSYRIEVDMLEGNYVALADGESEDRPYIPNPVPPCPEAGDLDESGSESGLRPMTFWAAMHLASPDKSGQRHSVLIAVPQHMETYSKQLLLLIEKVWANEDLPAFFGPPADERRSVLWDKCLLSCEDYFGKESTEYRLLRRGVVVHHGSMPGLTARTLVQVIQQGIVSLVLATSTLSDGVNLPFETILIPTLRRNGEDFLSAHEFANLSGRAGRPGYAIEGKTLVVMGPRSAPMRKAYQATLKALLGEQKPTDPLVSPLVSLMVELFRQWGAIAGSTNLDSFLNWLEETIPQEGSQSSLDTTLDSLDAICLASLEEIEQSAQTEMSSTQLEQQLKRLWQRTYAACVAKNNPSFTSIFVRRTQALRQNVYKNERERRSLYRTSLPPREGRELMLLWQEVREVMNRGANYAHLDQSDRLAFICTVVAAVGKHRRFALAPKSGNRKVDWVSALSWWLSPSQSPSPKVTEITTWHRYVNQQFVYKFNWGLGSFIALAMDEGLGGMKGVLRLKNWREVGLPWIVFWMKELVTWGTLEPVAAHLMGTGQSQTRKQAEAIAVGYYSSSDEQGVTGNDLLDPIRIRNWASSLANVDGKRQRQCGEVPVSLLRGFSGKNHLFRVLPVQRDGQILWYDFAGHALAEGIPDPIVSQSPEDDTDFILDSSRKVIGISPYLES